MRKFLLISLLALAACDTTTTGQGIGFDDGYDRYRTAREAELSGGPRAPVLIDPEAGPAGAAGAPGAPGAITGADLAAAGIGPAAGSTFQGGGTLATGPGQPLTQMAPGGNAGISDEQDFGAVSSRQSIQSDAERLAAQRQAYQVIPPEPIPERPRSTGPNIVAFALSTTNQPGERVYSRSALNRESRLQRNCAKYTTSDQAQEAFLSAGGPQRDRLGVDPDGDGFACYWDPRPFRTARGG